MKNSTFIAIEKVMRFFCEEHHIILYQEPYHEKSETRNIYVYFGMKT